MRRGGHVVAFDLNAAELKDVRAVMGAMAEAGEVPHDAMGTACNGSALDLPLLPTRPSTGSSPRKCLVARARRPARDARVGVLKPGGVLAVTVPRWFPELVNWALDDEYHAPAAVGGHVRIYRESALRERLESTGLRVTDRHHAHGLHSPYWWLKCAIGVNDDDNRLVKAYHRLLVWDLTEHPLPLQVAERVLQPLIGKSLVLYATKPGPGRL